MVELHKGIVYFTQEEQSAFGVTESRMDPERAIQMALTLEAVATSLGRRDGDRCQTRAAELGGFATNVFELCPDEYQRATAEHIEAPDDFETLDDLEEIEIF